ncbi:MAG: TRL-like family protein [Myxococcales bacterium]
MKLVRILALGALAASLSGCAGIAFAGRGVPQAGLYVDAQTGEQVTQNALGGKSSAPQCASSILGIVTTGDASVGTAAKQAGITRIAVVDQQYSNLLGLFAKYCVVVHGE